MAIPTRLTPQTTVRDVVDALDSITGGRITRDPHHDYPWAMTKDSGIVGKAVTEMPGLVWGRMEKPVRRLAVAMTLTEHHIELASVTGVDAVIAHHPIADAASSGGVPLADYLPLYDLTVLECHEAFHGLHPGIAYLHGHDPFRIEHAFLGQHGLVVMVGTPVDGVRTLGDIHRRLEKLLERETDRRTLASERDVLGCPELTDSATEPGMRILAGEPDSPVGETVLQAFPHTGISDADLELLLEDHPTIGTLILSISSASADSPLVRAAKDHGLNVIVGTTHASEIFENGLPLGCAVSALLPDVEVVLFKDRVVSIPLERVGSGELQAYGRLMAERYLVPRSSRPASAAARG